MAVFIQKGDAPLTAAQAINRGTTLFEAEQPQYQREAGLLTGNHAYAEWANQWLNDNLTNAANNAFNHQLAGYRAAVSRLAQYRLADGRAEVVEDQATGEIDPETGEPVMAPVVIQTAVEPLPAEVEVPVYDPETGEQTGVEMVANPAIVRDDAERAAAQLIIDVTPAEVAAFEV